MMICCLLFSLNIAAQGQASSDSISAEERKPNLMVRLHQLQQYLDTKANKKVDPNYMSMTSETGTRIRRRGPTERRINPF